MKSKTLYTVSIAWIGLLIVGGVLPLLSGCGSSGNTAKTGTITGTLADMLIQPTPGAFSISRATVFRLEWPEGTTPPPTFDVGLYRYTDGSSTDSTSGGTIQDTKFTRLGDRFIWDLERTGGGLLDSGGVYYIKVKASSEEVYATYIVSVNRSVAPPVIKDPSQGAGMVGTVHHVVLSP